MTKVRVTALVGNTYHARVHMSTSGKDACSNEVDIDARPSDAINLAVRFNAPVYVNKQVCHHSSTVQQALWEHECHTTADACPCVTPDPFSRQSRLSSKTMCIQISS